MLLVNIMASEAKQPGRDEIRVHFFRLPRTDAVEARNDRVA